jgi:hypothetical protein
MPYLWAFISPGFGVIDQRRRTAMSYRLHFFYTADLGWISSDSLNHPLHRSSEPYGPLASPKPANWNR